MKIVVVGLGYVGMSSAVLLARKTKVIGVDVSKSRVDLVNARKSPVADQGLSEYLSDFDLDLFASTDLETSIESADYVVISTPTNYDESNNYFDTSTVEEVIEKVIKLQPKTCIVIKSTVPVGFTDKIAERYSRGRFFSLPSFYEREVRFMIIFTQAV